MLSAVYAPAQERDKDDFWHHLNQLSTSISLPWCIIGDFNEMLCAYDKMGGAPLNTSRTRRLNNLLNCTRSFDATV